MKARIVYDFTAESEHELSVRCGDMVTIVEQHDDGWTTCQYQSKTGFVPSSYYTVIETPDSTDTKTTLEDLPSVSSSMSGARSGNNDSSSNSSSSSNVAVNFPPTPSVSIVKTSSSANLSASSKKKKEPRTDKKKLKYNTTEANTILKKQLKLCLIKLRLKQYCRSDAFKKVRQRNELIKETVETERTYVKHLSNFVNLVVTPIKKSGGKILSDEKSKVLFSNVEQIVSINSMLLQEFEKAMVSWPESKIGNVLIRMAPFFKAYTTYVNNYDNAFEMFEYCLKKKTKFRDFLNEQVYTNAATERYKFDSYLILPIQRIPRYKMLIEDILKNTAEDHVEYADIAKALEIIKETATFVNEGKRQNENSTVLTNLSSQLKDKYKTLVQPNRKYVRESVMTVRTSDRTIPTSDVFKVYLFSDVIVLLENKESSKLAILGGTKRASHFIFFSFAKLASPSPSTNASPSLSEIVIEVIYNGNLMQFIFKCNSNEEWKEWSVDIEDAINQAIKANELKGLVDDSLKIGRDRTDLSASARLTLKKCNDIAQEFKKSEQQLLQLDNELRKDQEELRRLQEKIAREKQEIAQTETLLDKLETQQQGQFEALRSQFAQIRDKDYLFVHALKEENEAFKAIFGEDPSTEDLHSRLTPAPIVRQPRRPASNDVSLSTDNKRDSVLLPPPRNLVPPSKPPPPTPSSSKPVPPPRPSSNSSPTTPTPSSTKERGSLPTIASNPVSSSIFKLQPPPSSVDTSAKKSPRSSLPSHGSPTPPPKSNSAITSTDNKPKPPPRKIGGPVANSPPPIVYRKKGT